MRSTPIHNCMLENKSMGGAEFMPVVANATVCLIMVIGPEFLWWPVISYFIHACLRWLYVRDPHLSQIFMRYVQEADHYDPWPRANQFSKTKRPYGAGRDLLC